MINMWDVILAFLGGGVICVIAQILIDLTALTPARILVIYVTAGVVIYAVGLYGPLRDIFGAGVSLPLIGFGATIARGVCEGVDREGFFGILSGGITASAAGITAALLSGLSAALLCSSRPKRM